MDREFLRLEALVERLDARAPDDRRDDDDTFRLLLVDADLLRVAQSSVLLS